MKICTLSELSTIFLIRLLTMSVCSFPTVQSSASSLLLIDKKFRVEKVSIKKETYFTSLHIVCKLRKMFWQKTKNMLQKLEFFLVPQFWRNLLYFVNECKAPNSRTTNDSTVFCFSLENPKLVEQRLILLQYFVFSMETFCEIKIKETQESFVLQECF
jgi:hypothetical protein